MAKVIVKLEGMDKLQAAIRRAPELVKSMSTNAVKVTAFAVSQRMRATVAHDTGTLKNSISTQPRGLTGRVVIDPRAFYWRFLEYGTVKMAARAFIRPAAESESDAFEKRVREIGTRLERDWSAGSLR